MGPTLPISEEIHAMKYRLVGETFREQTARIANALKDGEDHFTALKGILRAMRFLPAGRVQSDMGSPRQTTAFNCFVSGVIEDNMRSIMLRASEAAETMRRGGGIGYDFSNIRPLHEIIASLDSKASGPVSFMGIYDAVCQTIASAGHRRGAQMAVLRIDHPDIEEFITAKQNSDKLTGFNISVGVTDRFMQCLASGEKFPLVFNGKVYKWIDARNLWEKIMRSTWDWAEPGVLFIDTINKMNNLWYCETISATNPCGEQPLPPFGACLLGSFNATKYVYIDGHGARFSWDQLIADIPHVVRAMDNVIDRTDYPLQEQRDEARNKRRIGLGITGLADAGAALGLRYGSEEYIDFQSAVLRCIRDHSYAASADLAEEKGSFPAYVEDLYLKGNFISTLPHWVRQKIANQGIRNSHLTSIAPTGTISLTADNVSSGIEPPFMLEYDRTINTFDGVRVETVQDFAVNKWGVKPLTANEIAGETHVDVLTYAQRYVDSAVSKTCNVGDDVTFEEFGKLYEQAYYGGAKGCTTFRAAGKRFGILNAPKKQDEEPKAEACFIDPETGTRTCE
jgi:ribonucleoside-diphosphate reductase alpha chain